MTAASHSEGPIDPHLLAVSAQLAEIEAQFAHAPLPDAERRRAISEEAAARVRAPRRRDVKVSDHFVGAPGREIPIRVYVSKKASPSTRILAYFHGGGWMVGSLNTHDTLCEALAAYTGYAVASVHYRRTPENPYPAPLDDCQAAILWLARHAHLWDARADTIAAGGDSAGAHLAMACAVRAIQESAVPGTPAIDRLLLFYPPINTDANTDSCRLFGTGPGLTNAAMANYWQRLRGDATDTPDDPLLYPARWPDLAQMPPTVLYTASHDLLRDEGEAYAEQLRQAGVPVVQVRARGMIHGFARMLYASPTARRYVRRACEALRTIA